MTAIYLNLHLFTFNQYLFLSHRMKQRDLENWLRSWNYQKPQLLDIANHSPSNPHITSIFYRESLQRMRDMERPITEIHQIDG